MDTSFLSARWYRVAALRPSVRSDVRLVRHVYRGAVWYLASDRAAGGVHRFTPAAHALICRMDGTRSVHAIWSEVAAELDDAAPTQDETIRLLSLLHAADLLRAGVTPDVAELLHRDDRRRANALWAPLRNPMGVKLPLFDPDPLLSHLDGLGRGMFGALGAIAWLVAVTLGVVVALLNGEELASNVDDRLLAGSNLVLMSIVFVALKILHELGHGLAARAVGARVSGTGVMFLVFVPVPYVDASSAAMLPRKRDRILVAAGGMLVETFLAALAIVAWSLLEPGTLARAAAFDIAFVAGVSTLLFNLNPLLRFDGYFILCDLLEMPNLAQRANRYWQSLLKRHVLRQPPARPDMEDLGERLVLRLYAPAALAYRVWLSLAIALFVAETYFVVGAVLAALSLVQLLGVPAWKALAYLANDPELEGRRSGRVARAAAAASLAVLAAMLPVPDRTMAEGIVWLPDGAAMRVGTDGFVERVLVSPGTWVPAGTPVLQGQDPALDARIRVSEHQVRRLEIDVDANRVSDRAALAVSAAELDAAREGLRELLRKQASLLVLSPTAGTVSIERASDLPGRHLREGAIFGHILPDRATTVRVVARQSEIELIRGDLRGVSVRLADRPERAYPSRVVREVPAGTRDLPSMALSTDGGGKHAVVPRADGQGGGAAQTLDRLFHLDVLLPPEAGSAFGVRVDVRFDHGYSPLIAQVWREARIVLLRRLSL